MTADPLGWLASEAGFPVVEEREGIVQANAAARDKIAPGTPLPVAVASLTGLPVHDSTLTEIVRHARDGLRASLPLGGWLAISVPKDGTGARIVFVPPPRAAGETDVAAGVAHELANALGAILGWAELAQRSGVSHEPTARALDRIERSARSARESARHLLDSRRGAVPPSETVCVGSLVSEVVELLEPVAVGAGVRVETRVASDLRARASRPQLFTIVWNLVQNAIEASPRDGVVTVEVSPKRGCVRVEVADRGPGIREADRARVFDPYFTTKPGGTGVGLALVRQTVDAIGGRLAVRSELGEGARFAVDLPRAAARAPGLRRPSMTKQSGVHARGRGLGLRVLVVEDDRAMRELMATALELAGARVVAAATAAEARAAKGPFGLALLDFGLDVRGDHLLAELRQAGSVSTAALVSGSAPPPDLAPDGRPEAWIRKPFDLDDLVETVARLRAASADSAAGAK